MATLNIPLFKQMARFLTSSEPRGVNGKHPTKHYISFETKKKQRRMARASRRINGRNYRRMKK